MNVADRIKETTTATSTATIALLGAVANYAPFLGATMPVGTTDIPVCVSDNAGNWEIADYTLTSASLLTRQATIWGSSNGGAAVTFPAGTKEVFCAVPAARVMKFQRTTTAAFSTVIPLTTPGARYMAPLTVTAPVTFTLGANPVQGALVYTSLIADGTSAITMPAGFKEWGGSMGYDNRNGIRNQLQLFFDGTDYWYSWSQAVGAVAVPSATTGITLAGPTGGVVSTASSNFTIGVTPVGSTITGTVRVTPASTVPGDTIMPAYRDVSAGSPTGTFTLTPSSLGARTISVTNNGGLTNPATITYTATASATVPATMAAPVITAGDGSVSIAWVAPSDGGSAILDATFTASTGQTVTSAANPATLTVPNGTAITVTGKARNAIGSAAAASPSSNSVTPMPAGLRLSPRDPSMIESGTAPYVYTTAEVESPDSNRGTFSQAFQSGVDGSAALTVTGSPYATWMGVKTASGLNYLSELLYYFYAHGGSPNYTGAKGGIAGATVAAQDGDIRRLRRVGTTLYAEVARASTPTAFTVVHTWTGVPSGVLYITAASIISTISVLTGVGLA